MLKAGVGRQGGIVVNTRLHADVQTAAGFAWERPVDHLEQPVGRAAEPRFACPSVIWSFVKREQRRKCCDYKIVRRINVVVPGSAEAAFRILEAKPFPIARPSQAISTHSAGKPCVPPFS